MEFAAPGPGGRGRADGAGESAGDSGRGAGGFALLRRRLEQHHLHGRRGEESQAQHSALADSGHGICADGLFSGLAGLSAGFADARRPARRNGDGARHSIRDGRSRGDGGAGADLPLRRRVPDGRGDSDFDLRLRQWNVAGRGARLLRDEPGRALLQVRRQAASALQNARRGLAGAGRVGDRAVRLRLLQPVAGLHHLRGAGLLHSHHRGPVCAALQAARCAAAVQSSGLSGAARALYRDGGVDLCRIIAIQAAVHVAGAGVGSAGHSGVSLLVAAEKNFKVTLKKRSSPFEWRISSRGNLSTLIVAEAKEEGEDHLERALGPVSLTALGVGAVIGAGIFVMAGLGAHYAGPGLMLSFVLVRHLGCAFAGLCYAEFAAMIPLAGSAYTYAYATLGELFAWIIGWDLTLEYAMGASTVSSGWSNYFIEFLKMFGIKFPLWLSYDHWTAMAQATHIVAREMVAKTHPELARRLAGISGCGDEPAGSSHGAADHGGRCAAGCAAICSVWRSASICRPFIIALVITWILVMGIKESAKFNAAHRHHQGLSGAVCAGSRLALRSSRQLGPRLAQLCPLWRCRHEFGGGYIFFAFIGFDAVSTTAQEAKNPQRDLPIGIIASLFICTMLYVGVAAVLTGMVPWQLVNIEAPITHAFLDHNVGWASDIITCGALAGLTSVMLVMLIGQTRVFMRWPRTVCCRRSSLPPSIPDSTRRGRTRFWWGCWRPSSAPSRPSTRSARW